MPTYAPAVSVGSLIKSFSQSASGCSAVFSAAAAASAAAIFGGRTFADFTNTADVFSPLHPIDQDFAKTGTLFQAYARALQECFTETTVPK